VVLAVVVVLAGVGGGTVTHLYNINDRNTQTIKNGEPIHSPTTHRRAGSPPLSLPVPPLRPLRA
jgi:hypothetical protein